MALSVWTQPKWHLDFKDVMLCTLLEPNGPKRRKSFSIVTKDMWLASDVAGLDRIL